MRCPKLSELPAPPSGKIGWPWTEESQQLPDLAPNGNSWPKVSIVTPSYNQGQFIEESIRSVLLQGYPDLEFMIIDGGSTDESIDVIKKYECWLTYWVSEPDRGQSHAINKGLEKSTGEFFNWHNADDVLTVASLATTAGALVKYPEAGYAHGYYMIIDSESKILRSSQISSWKSESCVPELLSSISSLKGGNQIGSLMRRDLVIAVGKLDEELHYIMDRDLMLRLQLVRPPIYLSVPTVLWREHAEAKTTKWNLERAQERHSIARKIFERENLPASVQQVKRTAFAAAHRFTWECYAKAGIKWPTLRHAAIDILYLPGGGWVHRRRIIKALAHQYSSRWLYLLYRLLKKIEELWRPFSSGQS